jgi:hypothetical protein
VNTWRNWILSISAGLLLGACQPEQGETLATAQTMNANAEMPVLHVLKSPTCLCCNGWVDHISERGFAAQISHPQDLNADKLRLGIPPQLQSCHTAVSQEGYVFEGHIPAGLIQRFLAESPNDAVGLAVPGMPIGSPGMEINNQFQPYDVLVMKSDGSTEVYAHIATREEQY